MARRDLKEKKESQDPQVKGGREEILVLLEQRERKGPRVVMEVLECLVFPASKAHKDRRERREIEVTRDLMETRAYQERQAIQDLMVCLENQGQRDHRDQSELR